MSRELARHVVRHLAEAGYVAYWAGGCVRDLLLGVEPNDYDVATNATPDQVRQVFGRRRTYAVGESFGVVVVLGPRGSGEQIEVATFRRETDYSDGRRPDGVEFCTAEEDAQRRDFTINGMFYDPLSETVHDFVGGQEDLSRRLVRAIGNPRDRMQEDKLRMLRAARFTALLEFSLEEQTAAAVREMAPQILIVSAERIAQELRKMLTAPQRALAMQLCDELNLLSVALPELTEFTHRQSEERWDQILELLSRLGVVPFPTAFAALLRDVPAAIEQRAKLAQAPPHTVLAICRRLRLSNQETDRVCWLSAHRHQLTGISQKPPAAIKRLAAHAGFGDLLQIERVAAAVEHQDENDFSWIDQFLRTTPEEVINPPEILTGRLLIDAGYAPGPLFKEWLEQVRTAQLNGEIRTTEEALDYIRQIASDAPDSPAAPSNGQEDSAT